MPLKSSRAKATKAEFESSADKRQAQTTAMLKQMSPSGFGLLQDTQGLWLAPWVVLFQKPPTPSYLTFLGCESIPIKPSASRQSSKTRRSFTYSLNWQEKPDGVGFPEVLVNFRGALEKRLRRATQPLGPGLVPAL